MKPAPPVTSDGMAAQSTHWRSRNPRTLHLLARSRAVGIWLDCHDQPVSARRRSTCTCTASTRCSTAPARSTRSPPRAAELGMPALGLTDHGVMNGAVEHYKACREHGIKPILGLEAYLVDDRRAEGRVERNHLTLLAATTTGFRNLVKLTSAGFLEGFRRGKANVDMELLDRHSDGVIALTGCLQSRFCQRLIEERPGDARAHLDDLVGVFGADNVYFEIQENGIPEQDKANEGIVRTPRELGRPLVGDGRRPLPAPRGLPQPRGAALRADQVDARAAEADLRHQRVLPQEPRRRWRSRSPPWPEAVPTTLEIAERCNVEIELGKLLLPRFPTPDGEEPGAMLRRLADEGLRRRYGDPPPGRGASSALEFELGVIAEMGFESYFLIVWDFVHYAKENGIAVGPGRGSAAGSIVAYALNITDLDPLANDLLFERFLNPARKSMPDIDIDFSVRGRERVIRYVAGEVRPRVGRPDHHLRQDGAAGRDPRRGPGARLRLRHRRPAREADPRADHGPQPELRGLPEAGPGAAQRLRRRPEREQDRRRRAGPRGHRPQQLDPRRRGGDRRPPARRDRAAAARRGPQGAGGNENGKERQAGALVQDRHPVLDGADRGDRPAEDGLPRPAQPRRDRGRGRHHPALARRRRSTWSRSRSTTPRPTRCFRARRLGRRLPARVRGHARGAQADPPDRVQRHRRDRRPLSAGRDALHPRLRARQARPRARSRYPDDAPAPDHRGDLRLLHLPGAADGDLQADRRLHAGRGGRPAQGGRQEEARPDGDDGGQVHRRLRGFGHARQRSPTTCGR